MPNEPQLDLVFKALSDSTRRKILIQLGNKGLAVGELSEQFDISKPAVTKHLNVLENAGLLRRVVKGKQRICFAEPDMLKDAEQWLEFYLQFWNDRLDGLKDFLESDSDTEHRHK
ncbi:MAG: DNA-binding transcriptional ArsR family regulator [Flavobacteriales bacterium]|jgi:DNA-binding transcriptional ArsR family regulator